MKRFVVIPFFLLVAACADNAIIEVTLNLPAGGASPSFAYVQSRSADTIDFVGDWAGADAPDGFALTMGHTSSQTVSFVTSGGAMTRPLGIRVRICSDHVCGAIADTNAPEAHFVVERAFYRGKRTRLTLPVAPATPAPLTTVHKCEVAGCTMGTATSYCYMDGRHFCE